VLHAYYRDVMPVLTAALLPLFFISGVLFPLESLPGLHSHRWAEPLLRWGNPIAPFVNAMHSVLYYGRAPSLAIFAYILAAATLALAFGLLVFQRLQRELAVVL
jgi:ABC-type polysaccharide/polyol phosphate export permease